MIPKTIKYEELGYQQACAAVLEKQAEDFCNGIGELHIPAATVKNRRLTQWMLVHIEPEIFIQTHGTTKFTLPDQELIVRAGDVCVIPRHVPHAEAITPDGNGEFCNLVILPAADNSIIIHFGEENQYGRPDIGSPRERFQYESGNWGPDFFDRLFESNYSDEKNDLIVLRSGITMFFVWLAKVLREKEPQKAYSQMPLIMRCREYIEQELHNIELSVPVIAKACRCSPNHLSTAFHKESGVKLVDYINSLRILKAEQLLEQSTLQISEVAYACGFRDPTYFSKLFKKKAGYTPKKYRLMHP